MTKEEARAWVDYQRDARIRAMDERQARIDAGEYREWARLDPEPETSRRREVQPVKPQEPAVTPATTDADWNAWCDGRIARAMAVQAANVDGLAKEIAGDMNLLQSEVDTLRSSLIARCARLEARLEGRALVAVPRRAA